MNPHLTPAEIAEWFSGERHRRALDHLRHCPECRNEIASFEKTLLAFRGSVRDWSSLRFNPARCLAHPKRAAFLPRPVWLAAALALLLAAGLTVNHHWRKVPIAALNSDDALLQQVHEQVYRTVPMPMAPLTGLVSWDGKHSESDLLP